MEEAKASAVETKTEEPKAGEAKPTSFADTFFDTVTGRAAKALVLAGRGLAASAKWLEAQAKAKWTT